MASTVLDAAAAEMAAGNLGATRDVLLAAANTPPPGVSRAEAAALQLEAARLCCWTGHTFTAGRLVATVEATVAALPPGRDQQRLAYDTHLTAGDLAANARCFARAVERYSAAAALFPARPDAVARAVELVLLLGGGAVVPPRDIVDAIPRVIAAAEPASTLAAALLQRQAGASALLEHFRDLICDVCSGRLPPRSLWLLCNAR
jgi:hypothetical protein